MRYRKDCGAKNFGLSKEERLRNLRDFNRVRTVGRKVNSTNFSVFYTENHRDWTRIGIGIRKRIANAPRRNRAKRLIREFFRLNKHRLPKGLDLLILPKRDIAGLKYLEVERELGELLIERSK